MTRSIAIAIVMLIGAATVGIVAFRHSRDAIAPNSAVGLRIRATSTSLEAWYAGQRATVPYLYAVATLLFAGGMGALFLDPPAQSWVVGGSTLVGLLLALVAIFAGKRAAQTKDLQDHNSKSSDL